MVEKNIPQQEDKQLLKEKTPAAHIPLWMIVFIILLLSIILALGSYIVLQKGWGITSFAPSPTGTPTVTPAPSYLGWNTYTDTQAGFELKYPPGVLVNDENNDIQPVLYVSADAFDTIPEEYPLGLDRKTALEDKAALEQGEAVTKGDFAASDGLVNLGSLNARLTSTLSRFEICSVLFERKLVFYPNNYRVTIFFPALEENIVRDMPEFFIIDPVNCGGNTMWNRDKRGDFMPTLAKREGKGSAQVWFDTFNSIIRTVKLIPPVASPTPTIGSVATPTLQSSCDVSDNGLCNIIADLKAALSSGNHQGMFSYQELTSVTCDPDGMVIAICDGVAKGVVKEGYGIGRNQSEGSIMNEAARNSTIQSYISSYGPFVYRGTVVNGDRATVVFLNQPKTYIFVFNMYRTGMTWRYQTILLGQEFGDKTYTNLTIE